MTPTTDDDEEVYINPFRPILKGGSPARCSPRWVLHGTPASGAGIMGCLEAGVSVIALCEDTHHETHLGKTVRERAVEAMLAGSNVFKDDDLQARALELMPKTEKKDKLDEKAKADEKDGEREGG